MVERIKGFSYLGLPIQSEQIWQICGSGNEQLNWMVQLFFCTHIIIICISDYKYKFFLVCNGIVPQVDEIENRSESK